MPRRRGLDELGTEDWIGEEPRIGRGVGAADWTGFGWDGGFLWDFWGSVLVA